MNEKWIAGGVAAFMLVVLLTGYFSNKEKTECRKEGLAAGKTVDEIIKLCNLPRR